MGRDNTLPDQVAGMKDLARQYQFIDIDRAAMWGHSGGGFITADAMFREAQRHIFRPRSAVFSSDDAPLLRTGYPDCACSLCSCSAASVSAASVSAASHASLMQPCKLTAAWLPRSSTAVFKVGISESGNHDQRLYEDDWGERYQGQLSRAGGGDNYETEANQSHAHNLRGKLLLAHGTLDSNVPPENTLIVVDA